MTPVVLTRQQMYRYVPTDIICIDALMLESPHQFIRYIFEGSGIGNLVKDDVSESSSIQSNST